MPQPSRRCSLPALPSRLPSSSHSTCLLRTPLLPLWKDSLSTIPGSPVYPPPLISPVLPSLQRRRSPSGYHSNRRFGPSLGHISPPPTTGSSGSSLSPFSYLEIGYRPRAASFSVGLWNFSLRNTRNLSLFSLITAFSAVSFCHVLLRRFLILTS